MGYAARDDGRGKRFARQTGVLLQQELAPLLAQIGMPRGRRVGQHLARAQIVEEPHHRRQKHCLAILFGNANRGIVTLSLVLGLGALGQDPLGKEQPFAEIGQHRTYVWVLTLDHVVQIGG